MGVFPGRCLGLAIGIGEFQKSHWVSTPVIRLLRFPSWNTDHFWWDLGLVGTGHPCGGPPRALVRDNPAAHEAISETRG